MKKHIFLLMILLSMLSFIGCGKKDDVYESEPNVDAPNEIIEETVTFRLNTDYITSNPLVIDVGTEMSSELSDWVICEDYEKINVSIDIADSERNLTKLPNLYYPISSPYIITFTNVATNETLLVEVHVNKNEQLLPDTYDVTLDPYYSPVTDEDITFEPELYTENTNYFYCTNLSVLTSMEDFLPTLAVADFANQVGNFIFPLAEAGNWGKPESCYILESTIEKTDSYSRFHIYINPIQNLEIQVTYYYDSGYKFVIVKT